MAVMNGVDRWLLAALLHILNIVVSNLILEIGYLYGDFPLSSSVTQGKC
jgi:hypothetical protein